MSYPFSKFTRVEGSVFVRHANDHRLRNGEFRDVDLVSNYLAVVHDNSRWTRMGPSAGSRLYLSAGFTRDLSSGAGDYASLLGEYRHYLNPGGFVVSATRIQGQTSLWRDAQRHYIGGPINLRGYSRRALYGQRTVLFSEELRFPVVRGLTFAIPVSWSFPTINGALFADAAWAWDEGEMARAGGLGAGLYIGGGYFPAIRWNFVWPTEDFRSFARKPGTQFSIGYNF
jgi:hemolysin activation/secretion protein